MAQGEEPGEGVLLPRRNLQSLRHIRRIPQLHRPKEHRLVSADGDDTPMVPEDLSRIDLDGKYFAF